MAPNEADEAVIFLPTDPTGLGKAAGNQTVFDWQIVADTTTFAAKRAMGEAIGKALKLSADSIIAAAFKGGLANVIYCGFTPENDLDLNTIAKAAAGAAITKAIVLKLAISSTGVAGIVIAFVVAEAVDSFWPFRTDKLRDPLRDSIADDLVTYGGLLFGINTFSLLNLGGPIANVRLATVQGFLFPIAKEYPDAGVAKELATDDTYTFWIRPEPTSSLEPCLGCASTLIKLDFYVPALKKYIDLSIHADKIVQTNGPPAGGSSGGTLGELNPPILASLTWTGEVSDDWFNPTNWIPQRVPSSGDSVTIQRGNVRVTETATFGELNLQEGNLFGNLTVSGTMNWIGGTLYNGVTTVPLGKTLNVRSGQTAKTMSFHTINNAGAVVMEGTGVTMNYGSVITNAVGGVFEVKGDAILATGGVANNTQSRFDNAGRLVKSGASKLVLDGVTFSNVGFVAVNGGVFSVNRGYRQLSGSTFLDGGALSGLSLGITLDGGSFSGSGTLLGDVINGGQLNLDSQGGVLSIQGNYTQTRTGVLSVDIGAKPLSTGQSRLVVAGRASFDGTLSAKIASDFTPKIGDVVPMMIYGSRNGSFATLAGLESERGVILDVRYGPSAFDLITVKSVAATPANPVTLTSLDNGRFQLSFTGQQPGIYRVQATTDFQDWITVLSTNSPTGRFSLVDVAQPKLTYRFYRVVSP